MKYPTLKEVETASRLQICKWMRFLEVTGDANEQQVMFRIIERSKALGGTTPEISKQIGWNP